MRLRALVLVCLAAGCSGASALDGRDAPTSGSDVGAAPGADLAPPDLGPPADLSPRVDLGPSADLAPADGIVWRGDFETGDFTQWAAVQQMAADRVAIVSSPVRQGALAARFTLNPGDQPIPGCCAGTERTEALLDVAHTGGQPGGDWYYAWSTMFPSVPNATNGFAPGNAQSNGLLDQGNFSIFQQFHNFDALCSENVMFGVDGATGNGTGGTPQIYMTVMKYDAYNCNKRLDGAFISHLGAIQFDHWYDFVLHVHWSSDPAVGFVEVWADGKLWVPKTYVQTLANANGVYLKQGFYRSAYARTNVVYHDGVRRGTTLDAVLAH